jgi:hypothetical protein
MTLNFVEALPEDKVQPRSTHTETARLLKENPTATGWANISPEGGYSKRATATAFAKEINEHTHDSYLDYAFEAVVRTVEVPRTEDNESGEAHVLYARYNPTRPQAGELAPKVEKVKKARKATETVADEAVSAPVAAEQPVTGATSPTGVTSIVDGKGEPVADASANGRARAKATVSK